MTGTPLRPEGRTEICRGRAETCRGCSRQPGRQGDETAINLPTASNGARKNGPPHTTEDSTCQPRNCCCCYYCYYYCYWWLYFDSSAVQSPAATARRPQESPDTDTKGGEEKVRVRCGEPSADPASGAARRSRTDLEIEQRAGRQAVSLPAVRDTHRQNATGRAIPLTAGSPSDEGSLSGADHETWREEVRASRVSRVDMRSNSSRPLSQHTRSQFSCSRDSPSAST